MYTFRMEHGSRLTRIRPIRSLLRLIIASMTITSFAQTPTPPAFEVSTVKLSKSGNSGSDTDFDNGRFIASNVLLKNIMQYEAYGIPEPRILGGPKWLSSEHFDIQAKVDTVVAEQLRTLAGPQRKLLSQALFQQLFADRFKLVTHRETRDLPVYALVVAKNGSLLHQSKESNDGPHTSVHNTLLTAQRVTMADLANTLTQEFSRELGRVVVDKTGLDGRYDLSLKWTPDTSATPMDSGKQDATSSDSGPSIFTAFQEQLGLKLESSRGPVQVLIIDHIELPTEN